MNYKSWIAFSLIAAFAGLTQPAFANMDKGEHVEFIQSLRQASAELKATDPALSSKLNGYADKKEKWAEKKEEKMQDKREDAAKLRAAANELKATRKDLADDLEKIADRCEKKLKDK